MVTNVHEPGIYTDGLMEITQQLLQWIRRHGPGPPPRSSPPAARAPTEGKPLQRPPAAHLPGAAPADPARAPPPREPRANEQAVNMVYYGDVGMMAWGDVAVGSEHRICDYFIQI